MKHNDNMSKNQPAKEQSETPEVVNRQFYSPLTGETVEAASVEKAQQLIGKKEEEGDVQS